MNIAENLSCLSTILSSSFSRCADLGTEYVGISSYSKLSSAIDQLPRQDVRKYIYGYDDSGIQIGMICDAEKVIANSFSGIATVSAIQFTKLTAISEDAFTGNTTVKSIWFPFISHETYNRINKTAPWGASKANIIYDFKD